MALTEKQLELKLCPIGFELVQEENPVEASRGGCNTVFHYCDALNVRASYAGCLHTLDAIYDGRGHLRPECEAAVQAGTCPAVAMRKQELKAKRALFFVDYRELTRRRGIEWAETEPVVKFGRSRSKSSIFVPTRVEPREDTRVVSTPAPSAPVEIETNIMEKVLKKKVENERND